jgi:anti-sigma factor RsiW
MRCAQVERLVDVFVDGRLAGQQAAAIEEHASGCVRCAESIRLARGIREALHADPALKAPRGFSDRVMAGVYRQALQGLPRPEAAVAQGARGPRGHAEAASRGAAAKVYRRLGLSFLLTAGVLAVSLLVPRIAYPTLLGRQGAVIDRESRSAVRGLLMEADSAVRGALGEPNTGGIDR